MSVLIKGMEMPKGCFGCHLFKLDDQDLWCIANHYAGCCRALSKYIDENKFVNERHPDCPLIEVPTPHGRLGDLDELEKQFKRAIGTYLPKDPTRHMDVVSGSECRGWTQALMAVLEAKTVIKAED